MTNHKVVRCTGWERTVRMRSIIELKVSHDGAHAVPHNGGCIITNTEEEKTQKGNRQQQQQEHAHNRFESYIHDTPL